MYVRASARPVQAARTHNTAATRRVAGRKALVDSFDGEDYYSDPDSYEDDDDFIADDDEDDPLAIRARQVARSLVQRRFANRVEYDASDVEDDDDDDDDEGVSRLFKEEARRYRRVHAPQSC